MLRLSVIGNLGADAQVKTKDGNEWIVFKIAHTESWTDSENVKHENTQWVSCIMTRTQSRIIEYLKKGTKVFAQGRLSTDVYSSPKERRMVVGLNLSVDTIELCGGSNDLVPKRLVTEQGVLLDVYKAFYINPDEQKANHHRILYGERGGEYQVDTVGFVFPKTDITDTQPGTGDNKEDNQ